MKRRRLAILASLAAFLAPLSLNFYNPNSVSADALIFNYSDSSYSGIYITGSNCGSSGVKMVKTGPSGTYASVVSGCSYALTTDDHKYDGDIHATYQEVYPGSLNPTIPVHAKATIGKASTTKGVSAGSWVDHNTITAGGQTYFDNKIDNKLSYQLQGSSCNKGASKIYGFTGGKGGSDKNAAGPAKIITYATVGGANTNCNAVPMDIKFTNTSAFDIYFKWADAGTIASTDETSLIFSSNSNSPNKFVDNGVGTDADTKCKSSITVDPRGGTTEGSLVLGTASGRDPKGAWLSGINNAKYHSDGQGCNFSDPISVRLADPIDPSTQQPANTLTAGSSNIGSSTGSDTGSCDEQGIKTNLESAQSACDDKCVSSNDLGWFLCKIYDGTGDVATWLFQNVVAPWLHEPPISLNPKASSYQAWSSFRIFGDVFLVIGLLVIVFGESIGGGLIDAYTAKKVLPRLLIAAVFINLSVYIAAAMVDISNIVGGGIGQLITNGAGNNGAFHITLNGVQAGSITGFSAGTGIGLILLVKLVGGLGSTLLSGLMFVGILLISAIVFGLIAMFITLVVRQAGILVLVLISPLAFAMYCLPNTEQYFRKWLDLFMELLLMYPLVVIILSAADLLSVAIDTNYPSSSPNGALIRPVISFVLQFLPLFFIPFTFRIASKTIGRVHDVVNGVAMKGHQGFGKRLAEPYRRKTLRGATQINDKAVNSLNRFGNKGGARRRFATRSLGALIGSASIDDRMADIRTEAFKRAQGTNDAGDDTRRRALTVNRDWALKSGVGAVERKDADGNSSWYNARTGAALSRDQVTAADWRQKTGKAREFQTLGGAWVNDSDVDTAYRNWGNDQFEQQWALGHEMEKAATQQQQDRIATRSGTLLAGTGALADGSSGSWGVTDSTQRAGLWKGAGFSKQAINRQWKHYSVEGDGSLKMNGLGMMQEIDEKQGNYQQLQQNADTWTTMGQEMERAYTVSKDDNASEYDKQEAQEVLERGARIAFATKSGSMVSAAPEGGEHDPPAGTRVGGRDVGSGAPGRVQEEAIRFVQLADKYAGVYQPPVDHTVGPKLPNRTAADTDDTINTRNNDPTARPQ